MLKNRFWLQTGLFFGNKVPMLRFVHYGHFYFYTHIKRKSVFALTAKIAKNA